jgi:hypothetical protein
MLTLILTLTQTKQHKYFSKIRRDKFVRIKIKVGIHKQHKHESITGRHVETPPMTSNSVCAR